MSDTRVNLQPLPPWKTGPTWQITEDGYWHLPEHTLGWGVISWMMEYLKQPEGANGGEAFMPTDEQQRFLAWWYAVDANGRYAYRSGVLRRLKGWGKDPLVAAMALAELCGPVAFSHYDPETGRPVGKQRSSPWIQVVAVSLEQTQNTFKVFPAMVTDLLITTYGLDVNKTVIYTKGGGQIQAVTSSPKAVDGGRPTLVIMNEIQWWVEANSGIDMFNMANGNIIKRIGQGARYLAICNAHVPGQDSVGERLYNDHQKILAKEAPDAGVLYDSLEAPAGTPVETIRNPHVDPEGFAEDMERLAKGIEAARGDAYWLEPPGIATAMLAMPSISEAVRMFLNWVTTAVDAWMDMKDWESIADPKLKLLAKDRITLGFDGSKSSDFTALVACRVSDGALFLLKVWDPADYPGKEVPREQVDQLVKWAFSRFDVVAFRADVKEFESYVDQWSRDYRKVLKVKASPNSLVGFDMRGQTKRFALDCEKFLDEVRKGGIRHDGNKQLTVHIGNCFMNPTSFDSVSVRKESKESTRKIDAAVCAILAVGARQDYLMSSNQRSGKAVIGSW